MKSFLLAIAALTLASCSKMANAIIDNGTKSNTSGQFIRYIIQKGNQYCDGNAYKPIETSEMKFTVAFDSTAIYQTQNPGNQYDINKLYGFSDNNADHHQFSARLGWRWNDKALRLFAYVYNNGVVTSQELTTVKIGAEINCSIKVAGNNYFFTVNGTTTQLPRAASTDKAKGYQLYPYFGGEEAAPHQISIWIRNL